MTYKREADFFSASLFLQLREIIIWRRSRLTLSPGEGLCFAKRYFIASSSHGNVKTDDTFVGNSNKNTLTVPEK